MDRDSEHADRAARGRRIFDALRRGQPEDEAEDSPGTGDAPTTTAVDDRPDDSPEASPEPPEPAGDVASSESDSDEGEQETPPADAGNGSGGVSTPTADDEDEAEHAPEGEPHDPATMTEADGTAEPAPPAPAPQPSGPLPGVETLRDKLGPPEAPAAPTEGPPAGDPEVAATPTAPTSPAPPVDQAAHDTEAPEAPEAPAEAPTGGDLEPPRSDALPRVIAIANQKGGVGKTTTAVNLGASLSELGYRVLIVDLDPQGNATTGLGIDIRNLDGSVYESLMGDTPLEDCIEATSVRNLFVAPSNMDLAGAEIELVPVFSRELKLRRAVEGVKDDYDFVLIDCPPSLGLLTVNGLAAADDVVVPIQCEYYALEGLGQLVNNVNLVRSNLNPVLDIRGIVLTMYDARTKLADQVVQEVRSHFGDRAYETVVPRTVRLSEAPSFGQPIIVFDNASRGSDAYRALAQEVAERVAGRPRDPVTLENDRDD